MHHNRRSSPAATKALATLGHKKHILAGKVADGWSSRLVGMVRANRSSSSRPAGMSAISGRSSPAGRNATGGEELRARQLLFPLRVCRFHLLVLLAFFSCARAPDASFALASTRAKFFARLVPAPSASTPHGLPPRCPTGDRFLASSESPYAA